VRGNFPLCRDFLWTGARTLLYTRTPLAEGDSLLAYARSILQFGLPIYFAATALPYPAAAADSSGAASNNPAAVSELPQITVIGNTPLGGLGLPMNQIPSNVQTADSKDMQRQQTLDLADYLNNNFSGVNVSESADNPFQLDINYHGFTAFGHARGAVGLRRRCARQ